MSEHDPGVAEVIAVVGRLQAGDPDARATLLGLWELSQTAPPMRRCTIAHFLADTEQDLEKELAWDLAALRAATGSDDRDAPPLDDALAAFLPSLHLNVGDVLRRMSDPARARAHAQAGLRHTDALPHGGYGSTVRTALARLLRRVGSAEADEDGQ